MTPSIDRSRDRVIDRLRRGPATLDELVNELSLTRTAVRLQIAGLERDGQVVRRGMRRGRTKPAHVYELTTEGELQLSRAYVPVLTQLLHVLADRLSAREFDGVMRAVGRELLDGRARPTGALRARADAASMLLDQLGGLTEVTDDDEGLLIRSHGCPLAATAVHHPETCSAMESLVSEFVGAPVEQRCERSERPRCRFRLENGAGAGADA
jgi:predicted ArsR family transcriptional regulator